MQLSYTLHSACASRRLFKCFLVIIGGGCPLDVLHRIPVFGRPDQLHAGLASDLHISYSMKITSANQSEDIRGVLQQRDNRPNCGDIREFDWTNDRSQRDDCADPGIRSLWGVWSV